MAALFDQWNNGSFSKSLRRFQTNDSTSGELYAWLFDCREIFRDSFPKYPEAIPAQSANGEKYAKGNYKRSEWPLEREAEMARLQQNLVVF